ncbi:enoyl-CoA hydratase/isomerase family protein [Microbaculum sp. FT89]|uniref:enoyl-CoA hydratase/isomerase family protein n=1 Tax=Microbaculum sp. FT89 TaxID=3447298 RepID=UPI003F529D09
MPVSVSWRDGACEVRLDAPNTGNAMSAVLVECMHRAFDEAEQKAASLLLLRANGRHFCTGFDLTDIEAETDAGLLQRFVRIEMLLARLRAAPFPTVAYAAGAAIGAGADLYVACARRFCAPGTRFAFPGAGFGIVLGTGRLSEIAGPAAARDLMSSGRTFGDAESRSLGITDAIIAPENVAATIDGEIAKAARLDIETRTLMRDVLASETADRDLAALVRSAVRTGLRDRILEHRARVSAAATAKRSGARGVPA